MQGERGMERELQALQQELQDSKTALHLSKDRLQEQDATIENLHNEADVCLLV